MSYYTPPQVDMLSKCENATSHVCECRCRGAAHGLMRAADEEGFRSLPKDDPHYLPSAEEIAVREKEAERAHKELVAKLSAKWGA